VRAAAVDIAEVADTAELVEAFGIAAAVAPECCYSRIQMQLLQAAGSMFSGKLGSLLSKQQACPAKASQRGHSLHQDWMENEWASAQHLVSRQDQASSQQRCSCLVEGSYRCKRSHMALGQLAFGYRRHLGRAEERQSSMRQEEEGRSICLMKSRTRENGE
jgi:hypothetical protein